MMSYPCDDCSSAEKNKMRLIIIASPDGNGMLMHAPCVLVDARFGIESSGQVGRTHSSNQP
jgi:hypothetical protein